MALVNQWLDLEQRSARQMMNPKFCIRVVSETYQWDKIERQWFFGVNKGKELVFSTVFDEYN